MDFNQNENHQSMQIPTPVHAPKDTDRPHGEKIKIMNSTPNGYNSISKNSPRHDGQMPVKKSHDSSKHSESSDHIKKKEHSPSKDHKHSSSSHSKHKDGSHKSNDISKPKEHSHEKDKKHSSKPSGSEHSKHSSSLKNGTDKVKSEDKSKKDHVHKSSSSSSKHSSDFKKSDKPKSEHSSDHKPKEKSKDGDKHKEFKDKDKLKKHESSKDKHDKPLADKPKEKSLDKPKDKHGDKPKDKHSDKDKHGEKLKDKGLEKGHKVKVKVEPDSSPEKKPVVKDHHKKSIDQMSPIKHEKHSLSKVKEENISDDDLPLSSRKVKTSTTPRVKAPMKFKEESSDDDEPISFRLEKAKKVKSESSTKKRKSVDSDYEDDDYKKPAKKVKKEKNDKKTKVKKETPESAPSPRKRAKKEEEQEVWKWWEEEKRGDGVKWKTLQHFGPVFAPLYERVPKNVKFYYDGKHMELSEETEEVAGFYGRMLDHDYTTKDVFNTNFFKDWKKVMTPHEKETIKDLKKCNFNAYNEYYKLKSEERKAMTKEEKLVIKQQNEELTQKYGFCIIDGHKQKIGNFKIEPPGLFRGRGEHPKMGMLKRRVQPGDVSINIGNDAKIPEPPKGHKWKKVLHDNTVTWLASWNENILNSTKYIMLNPSSKLKGEKDWQKYEMARKLKNHVDRIRKTYSDDFKSKEMKVRQRAVALYFIDKLALRAGNEKDEDTADTVGCCSLRVEHITLHEELDGQEYVVNFDFLGKDSIRYVNSVPVEKRAFKNVKLFMENKQPGDDLFDRLNTGILNKYLTDLMDGLTAKVFRTYNASNTLQQQLDLLTKEEMSLPEKILAYNRANRAVALLCNHQRAIPKTFSKSMDNLKSKIDDKLALIKEVKKELKAAKADAKSSGSTKDKQIVDKKRKRLETLDDQLKKLEVQATDKEENKQIALGTSKLNYLDPRISVAWCKKWEVPIEKIYNKTQRDKFRWAIEMAGPEFEF